MIDFTELIQKTLKEFDVLDAAVIDASSCLYLTKLNLLNSFSEIITLSTVPGVVREVGELPRALVIESALSPCESTDSEVIRLCAEKKIPVISEDKKILLAVRGEGLPFFNTLMVLNFLFFKQVIDLVTFKAKLAELTHFAWYHADVYEYGDLVCRHILNHQRKKAD